jgi:hypothetical protein
MKGTGGRKPEVPATVVDGKTLRNVDIAIRGKP